MKKLFLAVLVLGLVIETALACDDRRDHDWNATSNQSREMHDVFKGEQRNHGKLTIVLS